MAQFGERSRRELATLHPELQRLLYEVIRHIDFTVTEGHRDKAAQDAAFERGASKVQWPNSKHNATPSLAADIYPYPINFKQKERFYYLAGIVKGIASQMGITIRWGGDWDGDADLYDQTFYDLPHFELVNPL